MLIRRRRSVPPNPVYPVHPCKYFAAGVGKGQLSGDRHAPALSLRERGFWEGARISGLGAGGGESAQEVVVGGGLGQAVEDALGGAAAVVAVVGEEADHAP